MKSTTVFGQLVVSSAFAVLVATGCDSRETTSSSTVPTNVTEKTEVKDKILGGTEVEKTRVIEQGDKVQVQKTETDIDSKGNVTEEKKEVKGDKLK